MPRPPVRDRTYRTLDERAAGRVFGIDRFRRRMEPNYVYINPLSGGVPIGEIRAFGRQFVFSPYDLQVLYGGRNYYLQMWWDTAPYWVRVHDNITGAEVTAIWNSAQRRWDNQGDPSVLAQAAQALNFFAATIDDMGGTDFLFFLVMNYVTYDPCHGRCGAGDYPPGMEDPIHDDADTCLGGFGIIVGCYDGQGMCSAEFEICNGDCGGEDIGGGAYQGLYPTSPTSESGSCDLETPIDKFALGFTRHQATWVARGRANLDCSNRFCIGCCGWDGVDGHPHLGGEPDPTCACAGGDVFCICFVTGYACRP